MMESPTSDARSDALERLTGGSGQQQSDRLSPGPSTSKAQRRQTAYYPMVNSSNKQSKPFSRSAAKRESVLQLGSIEHLQHYFTKTSIKAPNPALAKKNGLGPALPHLQNPYLLPTIVADFEMPPSPAIPPPSRVAPFASFERTYEVDPEALKPGVLEDLAAVVRTWQLEDGFDADLVTPTQEDASNGSSLLQPSEFNVLAALKNTTRAIRSVRNYVLALPDEPRPSQSRQFRPGSLSNTPRHAQVKHAAKHGTGDAQVRKAALDVLTVLRDLEEHARIPGTENADDSMPSNNSGVFLGEGERSLTPSSMGSDERRSSFGGGGTSGRSNSFSVPVWEDDEDEEEVDEPKREGWDDRLVLGGGWLYRTDIKIAELHKERATVQRYLDTVDKIVFSDGSKLKSPPKIIMTLTEEPEESDVKQVQDRELPNWARRQAFGDDLDGTKRARALLAAFLPAALLPLLPIDGTREDLLAALSSGQVLCAAYNAAVRKSKKPWGYIDADAVHDIAAETSTADKVWTFRKIENLRLFAAAAKLRYLVPLVAPGQNAPPGPEPPIVFDARVVARQETGWDASLERVVRRWVDAVVAEKRAER